MIVNVRKMESKLNLHIADARIMKHDSSNKKYYDGLIEAFETELEYFKLCEDANAEWIDDGVVEYTNEFMQQGYDRGYEIIHEIAKECAT